MICGYGDIRFANTFFLLDALTFNRAGEQQRLHNTVLKENDDNLGLSGFQEPVGESPGQRAVLQRFA
jgi:hypothetical protein